VHTSMKKLATLAAGAVFAVGACSSSTATAAPTAAPTSAATAAASVAGTPAGKIVIGFSQRRIAGSDWWKTLVQGATDAAAKAGVTLEVLDAGGDTVKQNADIQTLITKGVNAIIINPNDPVGLKQAVAAATAAGIPVIAVNCALDDSILKTIYGYVVEDQVATGARGGYLMAPLVAKRNPDLVGKTAKGVVIGGYPGDVLSDLRAKGYMQGYQKWLDENPGKGVTLQYIDMKYGHWIPQDALPVMRDVATANPDLKVVFSESDVMHAGIVQALKAAGIWDSITMAEYDGYETTVKEMIDNPNGPTQVLTTNEPYRQGLKAIEMAIRAVGGHAAEGTVFVDTVAFDVTNASKYYDPSKVLVDTVQ
jgi:ribose transport system substrate-binding protein